MIKLKNFILLSKDIILRIKKQIFLVISILCLIFLLAWTFVTIDKKYIVQGFVWERSITVEEYTLYHESGWSIPTGSTVTSSRKEIHHYESVFDYYQCINEHLIYEVDKQVPVYKTKYYYDICRWKKVDSLKTQGTDQKPYWYYTTLPYDIDYQEYGDKKQTTRTEKYIVIVVSERGKRITFEYKLEQWQTLSINDIIEKKGLRFD